MGEYANSVNWHYSNKNLNALRDIYENDTIDKEDRELAKKYLYNLLDEDLIKQSNLKNKYDCLNAYYSNKSKSNECEKFRNKYRFIVNFDKCIKNSENSKINTQRLYIEK